MEQDKYDRLRESYDDFIRRMIPELMTEDVEEVMGNINGLIRTHRPANWAFDSAPDRILGMTCDNQVIYGEPGRLGFYHVLPLNRMKEMVSGMVDEESRRYAEGYKPSPHLSKGANENIRLTMFLNLEHKRLLLERLVELEKGVATAVK